MAVIINNGGVIPTGQFEINGKRKAAAFQANAAGNNDVAIYNIFDTRQELLSPTNYSEFIINGATYLSQESALVALVPVLFTPIEGATPSVSFGDITGDPAQNAPLQNALDGKQDIGAFAAWGDITGKPTTILGFGITDAYTKTQVDAQITTAEDRANHTGFQAISTVTSLQSTLDGKVPTTRNLIAGTGLTGGGTLAANRTFSLDLAYTDNRYFRKDVANIVTQGWTFNSRPSFNGGVSGTTSPFTVDSNTKVTNLNADLLDSLTASQFMRSDAQNAIDDSLILYGNAALKITPLSDGIGGTWLSGNSSGFGFLTQYSNTFKIQNNGGSKYLQFDSVSGDVSMTNDLDVTGTITAGTIVLPDILNLSDSQALTFGNSNDVEMFYNGTSNVMEINMFAAVESLRINSSLTQKFRFFKSSGNFLASGTVTANSDIRIKENITPISGALDKVCSLGGYTWDRIDTGERQTGVVAQEVQAVLPEAVIVGDDEDKTLSVAYGNMVGLLIEAVKELRQEVKELRYGSK